MARRNRTGKRPSASAPKRNHPRAVETRRTRVNAISPARAIQRAWGAAEDRPRAAASEVRTPPGASPPASTTSTVPDPVRQRFVVAHNIYYFASGARAFVDHGDQLTTRNESAAVIKSLATIAQARGWQQIAVSGTARFKRQMWLAARLAGLAVRGYQPDTHTQDTLVDELLRRTRRAAQRPSERSPPAAAESHPTLVATSPPPRAVERSAPRPREWRGRLLAHRSAPYRHDLGNDASYVVKLQSREGVQEIWGVDLQRALRASVSHAEMGDEVVIRRVGQDEVTVRAASRNAQGATLRAQPRQAHRHRYVIETREFLDARAERARLVRDPSISAHAATQVHPELATTYLQLRAAQLAAGRLAHPQDQRRFLHLIRGAIADSIARGEPMGSLGVRSRSGVRDPGRERPPRAAELQRG